MTFDWFSGENADTIDEYFSDCFLRKMKEWSYEEEFRVVRLFEADKHLKFLPSEVVGVVFGAKCPPDLEDFITSIVKESDLSGIKIGTQAKLDESEYKVTISRVLETQSFPPYPTLR